MIYQLGLSDVANIGVFFGLCFSGYVVFYFSQKIDPGRQVTPSIFTLALGLNLIGISHLFRIGSEGALSSFVMLTALLGAVTALFGSVFTFAGILVVFHQKSTQITNLKKRYEEIKAIMSNLKKKYYQQEISEEDLRTIHSTLVKELAELEVKMKESDR